MLVPARSRTFKPALQLSHETATSLQTSLCVALVRATRRHSRHPCQGLPPVGKPVVMLAAAAVWPLLATGTLPPNMQQNYSLWVSQLHSNLLRTYVKAAPPTSLRRFPEVSEAGTDVIMQLRLFKMREVDTTEGRMSLKAWWRLRWSDTRLAWNPGDYGGITELKFHAAAYGDVENSEIWVPDLTPYNAVEGIGSTFDAAMAVVQSDGSVFWSRPGTLDVLCRFSTV